MPLYDYQCDQCGHRFEVRQGIKEDALKQCPQCGGAIRRVIHPVGIVFKGSGFYITDSRGKSSTTASASSDGTGAEKADKAEKKESSGSSDGKTESKPAAASTTSSAPESKSS